MRELFYYAISIYIRATHTSRGYLLYITIKLFFFRLFNKTQSPVEFSCFNFKITALNYDNLNFLLKEIFLKEEYYFQTKKDSPLIIDCGSNIGISVLYFKYLYPNATILAFEPQQQAFAFLEKNVRDNNLSNVFTYNVGLSNVNAIIDFFEPQGGVGLMASVHASRETNGTLRRVKGELLSSFLKTLEIPDLIKIDVEGAEMGVIQDLVTNRQLNANQIILEYHHNIEGLQTQITGLLNEMETSGYRYSFAAKFETVGDPQDVKIHFIKTS